MKPVEETLSLMRKNVPTDQLQQFKKMVLEHADERTLEECEKMFARKVDDHIAVTWLDVVVACFMANDHHLVLVQRNKSLAQPSKLGAVQEDECTEEEFNEITKLVSESRIE